MACSHIRGCAPERALQRRPPSAAAAQHIDVRVGAFGCVGQLERRDVDGPAPSRPVRPPRPLRRGQVRGARLARRVRRGPGARRLRPATRRSSAASAACSACRSAGSSAASIASAHSRGRRRARRRRPTARPLLERRRDGRCAAGVRRAASARPGRPRPSGRRAAARTRSTRTCGFGRARRGARQGSRRADRTGAAPASFCWAATSCSAISGLPREPSMTAATKPAWAARPCRPRPARRSRRALSGASATRSTAGSRRSSTNESQRRVAAPDLVGVIAHDQRQRQPPADAEQRADELARARIAVLEILDDRARPAPLGAESAQRAPNRLSRTRAPRWSRCVQLGWLELDPHRSSRSRQRRQKRG